MSELPKALCRAVDCFRRWRVPYALIGAWALAAWGKPRATVDVDFLVLVSSEDLESLAQRLVSAGMVLDEEWQRWNPMLRGIQIRLGCEGVSVDLLRPRDAHDRAAVTRRRRKRMDSRYYWLVAPDDYVLQKLKMGRPRDFEDAITVIERSGPLLNRRHLRTWAARLHLTAELDYVFSA